MTATPEATEILVTMETNLTGKQELLKERRSKFITVFDFLSYQRGTGIERQSFGKFCFLSIS